MAAWLAVRRYRLAFVAVVVASCVVPGFTDVRIDPMAPPLPDRVVTADGRE